MDERVVSVDKVDLLLPNHITNLKDKFQHSCEWRLGENGFKLYGTQYGT